MRAVTVDRPAAVKATAGVIATGLAGAGWMVLLAFVPEGLPTIAVALLPMLAVLWIGLYASFKGRPGEHDAR
jgi:hypothetical protein